MKNDIVVKIGGSLLYGEGGKLNLEVLEKIRTWYADAISKYNRIIIVTGGGKLSRNLVDQLGSVLNDEISKHRIAKAITQINAEIIRGVLDSQNLHVPYTLGDAYDLIVDRGVKGLVLGGLKDGWSTDMDAAVMADLLDIDRVYKVSDIDFVYDKDPKQFTDAKPIRTISWQEYFDMFGITDLSVTHIANQHVPVDAHCARFSKSKGIKFFISGGKDIYQKDLASIFEGGTAIG